ncbi:hypothetical protein GH714_040339 [Hevea brasiliensis]|uniref:At2g35280-like TPR domain-containing protein n=1 Tax=Hevea brasiliensis TaxID=3981 RepID=A0A6A6MQ82_HEVBR|nr:hypothetical protein GH714_040339 [Hevea brasiliensis]
MAMLRDDVRDGHDVDGYTWQWISRFSREWLSVSKPIDEIESAKAHRNYPFWRVAVRIFSKQLKTSIYRQVSLERFPPVPWFISKQASSFLDRCKENGNPEALFRQGVVECFSQIKLESGLRCLKRAASSGHHKASYILGVILLCSENKYEPEGMKLIEEVKRNKKIRECRQKLKDIIWNIWLKNKFILEAKPNGCPLSHLHRKRDGWPSFNVDDDDDISCRECSCHREVIFVCNLLKGV